MPLERHPSWDVLDNSKLTTYRRCPREFFFRHVVGWTKELESHDLVFGEAWHQALDQLYTAGFTEDNFLLAYTRFLESYRSVFPPETDIFYEKKNPQTALEALKAYYDYYRIVDSDFEPLYVEVAGAVPISDEKALHFKIDLIGRRGDMIEIIDHKTSTVEADVYKRSYHLDFQPITYIHAACGHFPPEDVRGCSMSFTYFRKPTQRGKGVSFDRVLITRNYSMLKDWLWTVNQWSAKIDWSFEMLEEAKESDDVLRAFEKNPNGCIRYGRLCPYFDFCMAWPNPLQRIDTVQTDFEVNFWDPREKAEKDARYRIVGDKIEEKTDG